MRSYITEIQGAPNLKKNRPGRRPKYDLDKLKIGQSIHYYRGICNARLVAGYWSIKTGFLYEVTKIGEASLIERIG